ncbi:MAG: DUF559 domain-containing protein [Micrococcaceae bacterium]
MDELQQLLLTPQVEGMTPQRIRTLKKRRVIMGIRHGIYVERQRYESLNEIQRRVLFIMATATKMPRYAVSHTSAALLWGLDTYQLSWTVHFRVPSKRSSKLSSVSLHHYKGKLEATVLYGIKVTDVEDTVFDSAQHLKFHEALVIADSSLREKKTTKEKLFARFKQLAARRQTDKIKQVLQSCTDLSGSVGETLCRLALAKAGLDAPFLQHKFDTNNGIFYVDFYFPELKLIVEFDGDVKYTGKYNSPITAIKQEKRREEALRNLGLAIVRFDWREIHQPLIVMNKLQDFFPEMRTRVVDASKYFAAPFS